MSFVISDSTSILKPFASRRLISRCQGRFSANQGYFDARLECLATPWVCIPGYPEDGPSFLFYEPTAYLEPRHRYAREFLPGEPVGALFEESSPSSVDGFVYLAMPLEAKGATKPAFCGDHTGRICVTPNGERPLVEDGQCARDCQVLQ